jgi:hypothetical protein
MYDHFREICFPQITQIQKELENKPNFDKLPYLLGEISVFHHSRKICDLLTREKVNQRRTNTIVNTTQTCLTICISLQHCIYRHNMAFEMSLFFWNFCDCNVYCSFLLFISLLFIIYVTCFGNVNMCFPCQ